MRYVAGLTRVACPVEVIARLAVAAKVQPRLFTAWAMGEWNVVVGNLVPEVDFFWLEHDRSGDRVDRCIAPSLVEESTILVQGGEVVNVLIRSQPFQATNLEVRPLDQR